MTKPSLAARLRTAFLGDLEEQLATLNESLIALEADPSGQDPLKRVFRVMHTLKGAAHATDQPLVERVCHRLETILVDAREGRVALGPADFKLLFAAADALTDVARRIAVNETLDGNTPIARLVDQLDGVSSPIPAEKAPREPVDKEINAAAAEVSPASVSSASDATVRVAADKLDVLLTQVGRLLATRARIADHAERAVPAQEAIFDAHAAIRRLLATHSARMPADVSDAIRDIERVMRDLSSRVGTVALHRLEDGRELAEVGDAIAEGVRRVRMLPFASACEPLQRLVRDLAAETGKAARLVVHGGDVEADRPVLDAVKDSLLHLVRNAIDHGIETDAIRRERGKSPVAEITIRAALHRERLTVTVQDDGAGLDIDTVRAKLAAAGRTVPESDDDVARSLFEAGFSTRTVTTNISGRGVGLDAVEAAMLRVRGSVSVSWDRGGGTTFTLECPLTLAAIRAVLVRSGTQFIALPTSNVEQLLRVRSADVRRTEGRDVIMTGGVPIPLVPLASVLGPPFVPAPTSDIFPALIVSAGGRRVAFIVDAVETEQELVVRPIAHGQSQMVHVGGGALLGSGQLVLLLNPVSLVQQAAAGRSSAAAATAPKKRSRVLVADDSLTTRALEQGVLEAAGYEVATAVDGADAWRQLQENGADLLVTDIEMPNMDGLTLCRTLRASPRFANLPVVLVTSLDNPSDRERGLSAGADAYVGKASAGQAGLLATVQELLA